ncbi:MAG: LysM peptidoglycan-binding domain-containing protein [Gemmatimonadaceae bacterium]
MALLAPGIVHAQQTDSTARPATHTVKAGDTLWDLARVYLGDPFLWPEIYRINTDVVEDPHWIYPGESLRIPGNSAGEPGVVAELTPSDSGIAEEPIEASGPTMFKRPERRASIAAQRANGMMIDEAPAVRAGEYYSAPFVIGDYPHRRAGRILSTTEIPGVATEHERTFMQNEERIYVRVPAESIPAIGDRYLTYKLGPDIPGIGQIVVPTGIVVVEQPGHGDATIVRIVRQFLDVEIGQNLMPLDNFVSPPAAPLTPIELGPSTKIAWIQGDPALASLQTYLVVGVGYDVGVKPGDEFHVYRERKRTEEGDYLPAEQIAIAHAVRVGSKTATLIVTGQRNPAIREGARIQLSARMP